MLLMQPILLPSNQPRARFYRGGARISAFRGEEDHGSHTPEDWIASTTRVRGQDAGETILPGGEPLAAAIAADPLAWLGREHVEAFGADTKLLVKLIDAGQRLPVHAHPNTEFAHAHLGEAHGKAEAWYILAPGEVYVGLRHDVSAAELAALVRTQNVQELLALLHRVEVAAGDSVFVPPGVLHAIGAGIVLAEVQEPEDLSILLEWRDFDLDGAKDGHLDLGFDVALQAVEVRARSNEEIDTLIVRASGSGTRRSGDGHARSESTVRDALASGADPFFRLEHALIDGAQLFEPGFAVIIVLEGEFLLRPDAGKPLSLQRGSTVVVPHASGRFTLDGVGETLVARPPLAH